MLQAKAREQWQRAHYNKTEPAADVKKAGDASEETYAKAFFLVGQSGLV